MSLLERSAAGEHSAGSKTGSVGIEQQRYDYLTKAYRETAIRWCRGDGLEYEDEEDGRMEQKKDFSRTGRRKGKRQYGSAGKAFCSGAEEAGHQVEVISLIKNEIKGCLGCNACRYGKPCIQKDAFNELVPKIKAADCIVFASPLYFWTLSSRIKAFIERFYCIAEEDPNPPFGRYEKYPVKDCALLMTSADDFFWTFEQAVSYYQFALVHYIGFHDKGMLLAGGCGDTNGKLESRKLPICRRHTNLASGFIGKAWISISGGK